MTSPSAADAADARPAVATARDRTAVDALAERHLDAHLELDPLAATFIGVPGYDDRMPDLSPAGLQALADLHRQTLRELGQASPVDDTDKVTIAAMTERLTVELELHELGMSLSELNNIASPVQNLRDTFDLMPTGTAEEWSRIASRLDAMPAAIEGYLESLRLAASRGDVSPRRQVEACITQCEDNLGADGFFAGFVAGADGSAAVPDGLRADLDHGARAAEAGYRRLRDFLAEELLSQAPAADAVGAERYPVLSRRFLGAAVDLEETYAWGLNEVARIDRLMAETADEIEGGATVAEAINILDADPARLLHGTDQLQAWMQERSDAAIEALGESHFQMSEQVRRLECRIAPTHTGVIYYTGPSDDFSRPGRMWWSVPAGVTEFSTWRELTTVYHEGVPGHHLQVAQAVECKHLLNRWRRLAAWVSGHGEGWALYAEWLMADLGYMDDPGNRMGLLDAQSLRAARVVIDIGVHCELPAPAEVGGGAWTYDKAWQFLSRHSNMGTEVLRYELDRYLGWPGQAPSYKIGERLWLGLREESKAREGADFNLKAFHRRTLELGSLGLDILRQAALGEL
ncbi:DUF885 domain-containing protein [Jatrophihabitans sp.]|jgi:uncharacterized protein (DUF885 family)|uniref:DUF885 domain-containing protein n=1 Tax=Jatrophihabitans sp. TaxID=1932789 RepID=UPI002EF71D4D